MAAVTTHGNFACRSGSMGELQLQVRRNIVKTEERRLSCSATSKSIASLNDASDLSSNSFLIHPRPASSSSATLSRSLQCSNFAHLCKSSMQREGGCLSSNGNYTRRMSSTVSAMIHKAPSHTAPIINGTSSSSNDLCTTTYNTRPTHMVPPMTRRPQDDETVVQELTVYEVNQLDRGSPMLLSLSKLATDWYNRFRVQPLGSLGDLVPFSNKIFDGSLRKRLGITAGIISVIRHYPEEDGLLFEAVYSFYFGDFGHISVKGPYKSHEDTTLTVTGGSGIFTGVYGTVQIQNVEYPLVLFYRFRLHGIPKLPQALTWETLPPTKGLRPSPSASLPGFALPNFTD